jgi:hypothetical protein
MARLSWLLALSTCLLILAWPDVGAGEESPYDPFFQQCGQEYNISPALLKAVGWRESRWNPAVTGGLGEYGLMQILPATARAMGLERSRAYDPQTNICYAARLLREHLAIIRKQDPSLVGVALSECLVASYNVGPRTALAGSRGGPYTTAVMDHWRRFGGDVTRPTLVAPVAQPEAEVWVPEVIWDDEQGKVEVLVRLRLARAVDQVTMHCYVGSDGAVGTPQAPRQIVGAGQGREREFRFEFAAPDGYRGVHLDLRFELNKEDVVMFWPWSGITEAEGLPVTRIQL